MDALNIGPPLMQKTIKECEPLFFSKDNSNGTKRLLVSDVVGKERPVHTVQSSATVSELVKALHQWGVSGCPIVDAKGLLVGTVDFSDILHHIIAFGSQGGVVETSEHLRTHWEKFRAVYLSDVSAQNPLLRVNPTSKFTDALELLFSGVHRLLVVDPNNTRKVVNVMTQSDVLKFLNTHSELIPVAKQLQTIKHLELGTTAPGKLHSVLPSVKAKDAFVRMKLASVRALPVVDEKGTLISQISLSDIRLVFSEDPINLGLLELSVLDFAKKAREKSKRDLLIWVEPDDNLSSVLNKMVKENVHRVWVTNNLIALKGVVSITDLATILA